MNRILIIGLLVSSFTGSGQDYSRFSTTLAKLYNLSKIIDDSLRSSKVEEFWSSLVSSNSIPLVQEDSVAFLYRGNANTVDWIGDFNGWSRDKKSISKGQKIKNTDIWILKTSFPKDARFDYKIELNGFDWIIDLNNPNQQWSGVGGGSPNSELRMPLWKPDPMTSYMESSSRGKLEKDILINSPLLGYQITYNIYYPPGFVASQKYPVIFVTDGYEYLHERLGNMQNLLDNLISLKKIEPIIGVFIDHREAVNRSNNRRMVELAMNQKYLDFFAKEFVPYIESRYPISRDPNKRAILGTSLGGLTAAYFAFTSPGIFGMAGIQSPAFLFKPDIYTVCDNAEKPPVKVYMTTGVYYDAEVGARKMKSILEEKFCAYQYVETNQGHSWGNFRDTIDDILIYFFPPK
jgi:enterochelin esterase family protein